MTVPFGLPSMRRNQLSRFTRLGNRLEDRLLDMLTSAQQETAPTMPQDVRAVMLQQPMREPGSYEPGMHAGPPVVDPVRGRALSLDEIGNAAFQSGRGRPGFGQRLASALANVGRSGLFDAQSEDFLDSFLGSGLGTFAGIRDEGEARAIEDRDFTREIVAETMGRRRQRRMDEMNEAAMIADMLQIPWVTMAEGQPSSADQLDVGLFRIDTGKAQTSAQDRQQQAATAEQQRQEQLWGILRQLGHPAGREPRVPGYDYAPLVTEAWKAAAQPPKPPSGRAAAEPKPPITIPQAINLLKEDENLWDGAWKVPFDQVMRKATALIESMMFRKPGGDENISGDYDDREETPQLTIQPPGPEEYDRLVQRFGEERIRQRYGPRPR